MFCIKCGSKTNNVRLDGESIFRDVCSSCNYIHYVNPKIIVGALLSKITESCSVKEISTQDLENGHCLRDLWKWENH